MHTAKLFELHGKTAIITGGATGIGKQMAEALADMGANVVIAARNLARCQKAAAELEKTGIKALAFSCDVVDPKQVQEMVDKTMDEFGQIDILVNNSGTSWGGRPEDLALEDWRSM